MDLFQKVFLFGHYLITEIIGLTKSKHTEKIEQMLQNIHTHCSIYWHNIKFINIADHRLYFATKGRCTVNNSMFRHFPCEEREKRKRF